MDSAWDLHPTESIAAMHLFLAAFDGVPDPRAENARHDLGELLVIALVSVLCGAASCVEMSAFGRAKESIFRDFLKLKHAIPSHDTFSTVLGMIDPKALDAAFGRVLADIAALLRDGDVVAIVPEARFQRDAASNAGAPCSIRSCTACAMPGILRLRSMMTIAAPAGS